MHAYAETPAAFTDATNIPESGNGVADLLDEVKWELDWLDACSRATALSSASSVKRPPRRSPSAEGSANTALDGDRTLRVRSGLDVGLAHRRRRLRLRRGRLRRAAGASTAYLYAAALAQQAQKAWTWAQANPAVLFYNSTASPTVGAGEQEVPTAAFRPRLRAPGEAASAAPTSSRRRGPPATVTSSTRTTRRSMSSPPATPTARTARSRRRCSPTRRRLTRPRLSSPRSALAYLGAVQTSSNLGATTANPDPYLAYLGRLLVGDQPDQERPGEPTLRRRHLRARFVEQRHRRQGRRALCPLAPRRESAAAGLSVEHGELRRAEIGDALLSLLVREGLEPGTPPVSRSTDPARLPDRRP